MEDFTGKVIGRYQVNVPLGEGGMAVVYWGHDTLLIWDVALKFIRVDELPRWRAGNLRWDERVHHDDRFHLHDFAASRLQISPA